MVKMKVLTIHLEVLKTMRKLMVAGNWKMNGSLASVQSLAADLVEVASDGLNCDVAVFPSFPHIHAVAGVLKSSDIVWGGQNLSRHNKGAYTSEVSADMLVDLGCRYVLVGHSECRTHGKESDRLIAKKFDQAVNAGLTPVLCVGETLEERESGQTEAVVWSQIEAVMNDLGVDGLGQGVIAYEPVWAIGTGLTATAEQAQEVHQFIRSHLAKNDDIIARRMKLLYGGSCNGSNAEALFSMPDIDGGLIGGASLTAKDFMAICRIADKLSNGE